MQDPKNCQKVAIWAPSHNCVGLYLRNWDTYRQSEKNLLNSDMSSTCPDNAVNFGWLAAEIGSGVWGTPANFNGFRVLACSVNARHSSSGRQPNFAALNRGRHLCSAGRPITLGICPHSSIHILFCISALVTVSDDLLYLLLLFTKIILHKLQKFDV